MNTIWLAGCPLQEDTEVRGDEGEEGEFKLPPMPCPSESPVSVSDGNLIPVFGSCSLPSFQRASEEAAGQDVGSIDH